MTEKDKKLEKRLKALRKKFLDEDYFQRAACREAMNFVLIKRCRDCYGPVIDGNCGSGNP
jgi:hypothetical protein